MIDPQTPIALGVVGMSVAMLARGPLKALLGARSKAPTGGGCSSCPSGGACGALTGKPGPKRGCH